MNTIRETNEAHGFESEVTDENPGMFSQTMLLVVSEISEALEEFRNHNGVRHIYWSDGQGGTSDHRIEGLYEKPEGIPIEIADAVIRLFDFCAANKINLEGAMLTKMVYNNKRSFRHGNKKC